MLHDEWFSIGIPADESRMIGGRSQPSGEKKLHPDELECIQKPQGLRALPQLTEAPDCVGIRQATALTCRKYWTECFALRRKLFIWKPIRGPKVRGAIVGETKYSRRSTARKRARGGAQVAPVRSSSSTRPLGNLAG